MELAISQLVLSSMIIQLLAGTNKKEVDQTLKQDRQLKNQQQYVNSSLINSVWNINYIWRV